MYTIVIVFFRVLSRIFTKVVFKLEVRGIENVPSEEGVLVISNHVSYLDSMVIATVMNRNVGFVMAAKVYYHPLLHWAFKRLPMVPIESGKDKNYLEKFNKNCQDKINTGSAVCIYAEGQISNNGHLLEFKKGMEYISEGLNAEVPILPVHIDGLIGTPFSYDNHNKKTVGFNFKSLFKKIVVTFGKPVNNQSTAFEVRQAIKELEVQNFSERISSKSNLIDYIKGNHKDWNESPVIGDAKVDELWKRANTIAVKYKSEVENSSLIGVYVKSLEESVVINIAMVILGKQVINFETKDSFLNSGVEQVISDRDLEGDFIYYIKPEILENDKWIQKELYKDIKVAKFHVKEGRFSMSHENMLAYFFALKQLFALGNDSAIYCQYNVSTAIGYFIKVWSPFLVNSTVIEERNATEANVLVGDVTFINGYHTKFGTEQLRTIILLDGNREDLLEELNHSVVYQGLRSELVCPVITLSSPNYEGKSIAGKPLLQEGKTEESVGKPLPGVTIKIVNGKGTEVVLGDYGEVLVKGVMFNKDGWIKTGVTGKMTNAGFLVV